MERMAATEPLQAEPDSLHRPVELNRLTHIFRAGRMEAAGRRKKRRDHALVDDEESDESRLQRAKRRRTSVCKSVNWQSRVLRRGLNTIDHSEFRESSSSRTASRMRRRIRFRTTAFPSARGVVKPIRGPGNGFVFSTCSLEHLPARQNAAKSEQVNRVPVS